MKTSTRTHAPLLGLAALAALGLAAAPAQAQSLTLTDATAIISTSNGTSVGGDYTFGGGADQTINQYDTVNVYNQSAVSLQGGTVTHLNLEGGNAYVNGGTVGAIVNDGTGYGVGFSVTGGKVGSIGLYTPAYGTISGGTVGDVRAFGGNLNVTGGSVGNVTTDAATVTGGSLTSLTTYGGASYGGGASVSGGSIGQLNLNTGEIYDTVVQGSGSVTGGQFNTLSSTGGLNYDIEGAHAVSTTGYVSGGTFHFLDSAFYGGFDLTGTDLKLSSTGLVTGFLTDGQAVDAKYVNSDGLGFLDFNGKAAVPSPVPEASTVISLGLLLMLGGVAVARRKGVSPARD